jgi:hypothetical protein
MADDHGISDKILTFRTIIAMLELLHDNVGFTRRNLPHADHRSQLARNHEITAVKMKSDSSTVTAYNELELVVCAHEQDRGHMATTTTTDWPNVSGYGGENPSVLRLDESSVGPRDPIPYMRDTW